MNTFKYPFFPRLIYRFANIPITILLLLLAFLSLLGTFVEWYYIFPVLVDSTILFFLNRYYFRSYKTFPYKIETTTEKMICSDYFFSSVKHEISLKDITSIKGGIFSGTIARPIYLYIEKENLTIGINQHIGNYNKLVTIILSNIRQELYNELLDTMQQYAKATNKLKEAVKKDHTSSLKKKKKQKKKKIDLK